MLLMMDGFLKMHVKLFSELIEVEFSIANFKINVKTKLGACDASLHVVKNIEFELGSKEEAVVLDIKDFWVFANQLIQK